MEGQKEFEQGEVAFDNGEFDKSIQLYSKAISADPKNADFISKRGVAFFRLNKKEEALYDLDRALSMEPENPYRYSSRAFVLSNLGRIEDAIADYEKAIALDPEDIIAHNNLGLLQEQLGYRQKANRSYKRADDLAGIEHRPIPTEKNSDKNTEPEPPMSAEEPIMEAGFWDHFKSVFLSKEGRKEFIDFLKNGFKLKN